MCYKQMYKNPFFTDFFLFDSMEHNRSIKRMGQINAIIDWSRIEVLLINNYAVGNICEGAEAYMPLILMKCLLFQQWFQIEPDPGLETQTNDRIFLQEVHGFIFWSIFSQSFYLLHVQKHILQRYHATDQSEQLAL